MNKKKVLDWTKLKEKLRYLAKPAKKYGSLQFDNRIFDFLDNRMTEEEQRELIEIGRKMAQDWDDITSWLDKYEITRHREAALVHFLGHLLALGNDIGAFDT